MPFFLFLAQIFRRYKLYALYYFMRRKLSNSLELCVRIIFRRY